MDEIKVVYWSSTGNTETMAKAIAKGIEDAGKKAAVIFVDDIQPTELKKDSVFALGCPAMGDEVLDEGSMEPFVETLEGMVQGKSIALFGSYDWGDGAWMRDWTKRMQDAGANILGDEGLICNNDPDDEGIEACEKLGAQLAGMC